MNIMVKLGLVGAGLTALVIGTIIGIGFFLSPQDDLRKVDIIVAISGGETAQRTGEAIKLYKQGYAPKLLFSGAAVDHSGPSNAASMAAQAKRAGVPPEDILLDEYAETTAENAANSRLIIDQQGAKSLILVTSPYHQRRSSMSFRQELGPGIVLVNHSAVDSVWRKSTWWAERYTIFLTFVELEKIVYIWSTRPS